MTDDCSLPAPAAAPQSSFILSPTRAAVVSAFNRPLANHPIYNLTIYNLTIYNPTIANLPLLFGALP